MPGSRKERNGMVSTSLRRHDPDQVPGVEAYSLLSADLHQLPQWRIIWLLTRAVSFVKQRLLLRANAFEYQCGENAPRRCNQMRLPCSPLRLILNLQFFIQAGRYRIYFRLGVFWFYHRTESIPFEPDTVSTVVGKSENLANIFYHAIFFIVLQFSIDI